MKVKPNRLREATFFEPGDTLTLNCFHLSVPPRMDANTTLSEASIRLPREILHIIYNHYTGLIHSMAARIQQFYAAHRKWTCDDCNSARSKHKMKEVHACDDWRGCCYKWVCSDACLYYCENGHKYYEQCQGRWDDPPPYDPRSTDPEEYSRYEYENHSLYDSRTVECVQCSGSIYVHRQFTFENYDYLRDHYKFRVFGV